MSPMMQWALTVRFLTPAFLSDAEQTGRWRTVSITRLRSSRELAK